MNHNLQPKNELIHDNGVTIKKLDPRISTWHEVLNDGSTRPVYRSNITETRRFQIDYTPERLNEIVAKLPQRILVGERILDLIVQNNQSVLVPSGDSMIELIFSQLPCYPGAIYSKDHNPSEVMEPALELLSRMLASEESVEA